jgi:hypothetical protein
MAAKKSVTKKPVTKKTVAAKQQPVKKDAVKPVKSKEVAPVKITPAKSVAKKSAVKKVAETKAAVKTTAKKAVQKTTKIVAEKSKSKQITEHGFSDEYLVQMQKDPNWIHTFWEVSEQRKKEALAKGGELVLRLYDISKDTSIRARKKNTYEDIPIPESAKSWYIQAKQGTDSHIELGVTDKKGNFTALTQSWVADPARDYAFAAGGIAGAFAAESLGYEDEIEAFGSSGFRLRRGIPGAPGSQAFSSGEWAGSFSSGSFKKGAEQSTDTDDFFLWVKTRLILWGGTRPDADLQIQGKPFPLNPDGTFSLETDLPDCTKIFPVHAKSANRKHSRTITPVVVRRTE